MFSLRECHQEVCSMSLFKKLVLISVFVFAGLETTQADSAQSIVETRIVGGTQSGPSDWPWMVLLSSSTSTANFFCGASLVSEQWVLTAAHCVDGRNIAGIHAFVGLHDKSAPTDPSIAITKIIIHPDYDSNTSDNDLALLKLESASSITPLNIINSAAVIVLEGQVDDLDNYADDVYAIGWGDTEDPELTAYPNILRDVFMPYVSNTVCNSSLEGQVTDNMMCAGLALGGVDSCQGDSGGPLVFTDDGGSSWYQAGIVSWGVGCADAGNYGVYTRVEEYIDWIQRAVNGVTPSIRFGSWIDGKIATSQIIVENNSGTDFDFIGSVSSSNSAITFVDNCPSMLSAGNSCTVDLTFSATTIASYDGIITLPTNHPVLGIVEVDVKGNIVAEVTSFALVDVDSSIQWALAGDNAWSEKQVTMDGSYSFESGSIADNQFSSLFAYVNVSVGNTRSVFFDWKVCSEPEFDFLELWVDNKKIAMRSGNPGWTNKSVLLDGEGDHVIEWRYNKDYSVYRGIDAGWVSNVELDTASVNPLPDHIEECIVYPSQPTSSGGGAISVWSYLVFGLPLLMRRRFKLH